MARKNNGNGKWKIENGKLIDESAVNGESEESVVARSARPPKSESDKPGDDSAVNGEPEESAGARNAHPPKPESDKPGDEEPAESGSVETSESAADEIDPVSALQNELAAERDKYLRLAAEYDNFRKRSIKERESLYGNARADTITRLLPVYDNLERALKMECADEAFYKGVEMTMTQLTEIFEGMNVKQIPAAGEVFDPNRHDAVMSVEDPGLGEKIVKEECKKGFMLGERIIRHSTVVVAN